jgi:hypothetical protein
LDLKTEGEKSPFNIYGPHCIPLAVSCHLTNRDQPEIIAKKLEKDFNKANLFHSFISHKKKQTINEKGETINEEEEIQNKNYQSLINNSLFGKEKSKLEGRMLRVVAHKTFSPNSLSQLNIEGSPPFGFIEIDGNDLTFMNAYKKSIQNFLNL